MSSRGSIPRRRRRRCDCAVAAAVTIGQIASYVPGAGTGASASAAAAASAAGGKGAGSRRRGARRGDHDRVSKAEDVPEYKGSLPVDELLAFVEGSVPSPPGRVPPPADPKLRQRTKRKEPLPTDAADLKLGNGADSKPVEVPVPVPHLDSESLAGLLNGSAKHSAKSVSEPTANGCVEGQFSENEWPSPELVSHLVSHEDYSDGVIERKEKEFVVVQKKRKPKIVAAVNGDAKSIQPLNGFCFARNGTGNTVHDGNEDCTHVNGFGTEEFPETNGCVISRNSSKDSLAQSSGSDIDDLSHFVGEDGQSGCEQFVDAPLSWSNADVDADDDDDEKEESLSSFCSTMSSTESRQRLNSPSSCKMDLPDIDPTDVVLQDRLDFSSDHLPDDGICSTIECDQLADSSMIPPTPPPTTEPSSFPTLCIESVSRCSHLCCALPYRHLKHQVPVIFCDLRPNRTVDDTSSVMFSFGCTMSDHLVDGGLCVEAKCGDTLPATESELAHIKHPEFPADESQDNIVSFMYRDSISEHESSNTNCVQLPQKCMRTCNSDTHLNTNCVEQFRVHDVQSYMYTSEYLLQ